MKKGVHYFGVLGTLRSVSPQQSQAAVFASGSFDAEHEISQREHS
jgi:hypothetical protein